MRHLLTFIFIASHLVGNGKVIIKGKILHYDGKTKVYYCPTIEGIHASYNYLIQPGINGAFKIEYENPGFGTIRIGFRNLLYRFFHDADSRIYFEIDQSKINWPSHASGRLSYAPWPIRDSVKQAATVLIEGEYSVINHFYNQNLRVSYGTVREVGGDYYSQFFRKAQSPEKVLKILDSLMQKEFDQIQHLSLAISLENTNAEKVSGEIKQFLFNEVRAFYGGIFLKGMSLKRREQVRILAKDSTAFLTVYNRTWEDLVETFAIESRKNIASTPASHDYNDFIEFLSYILDTFRDYHYPKNTMAMDEYLTKRLLHYDSALFADEKSAFAYRLSGLNMYLENQIFYSPILLEAVYEMQRRYPNSKNMEHFTPQIEKLKDYLDQSHQNFNEADVIRSKYSSFDELLKKLKGKNLLVDIWATWCIPCVEEFKHKNAIQEFIDNKQLDLLYISIDKPEWNDRWQKNIKYNKLSGYHFRGDDAFIKDMWKVLGGEQGVIPRYALIDKNGAIVIPAAARPSNTAKLKEQINELLSKSK
jgi:thiol-disulfide isomerase/thioredoxin